MVITPLFGALRLYEIQSWKAREHFKLPEMRQTSVLDVHRYWGLLCDYHK